jgi:hypothetical protein
MMKRLERILERAAVLAEGYKKYKSKEGVYYWAEPVPEIPGKKTTQVWHVISQKPGYPSTEAFGDWLAHQKDADEIAQKLAKGEEI